LFLLFIFIFTALNIAEASGISEYDLSKTKADELFAAFLEVTTPLRTEKYNSMWYDNLNYWNTDRKKQLVDNLNIYTEEYWDNNLANLSPFEVFCWDSLYANFIVIAHLSDKNSHYNSEAKAVEQFGLSFRIISKSKIIHSHFNYDGYEEDLALYNKIIDAYEDIIRYQYHYFMATGDFYNFMTGETYQNSSPNPANNILDDVLGKENLEQQEDEAINGQESDTESPLIVADGEENTSDASPESKDNSLFMKILGSFKNGAISFSIAGIAFGVLFFMKRTKNKKDDISGNINDDE